jgi:Coenzyme PQQ synthesis protein D (PqqD)
MIQTIWFLKHGILRNPFRSKAGLKPSDFHLRWNVAPGVHVSRHDKGLVLLHTSVGRVFTCNGSAAWIWERLSSGLTLETIAVDLAAAHGLNPDQSTSHVLDVIAFLVQHRLVIRKVDVL